MRENACRECARRWRRATVLPLLVLFALACTPVQQGAVVGSGLGAGAGALIGHAAGDSGEGALIGAGVGAIAGALAADYHQEYVAPRQHVYVTERPYYQGYYEAPVVSRQYYYHRPRYADFHRHYYDRCCP